jgi:hypothetical protein
MITEQTATAIGAVVTLVPLGCCLAYLVGRFFAKGKLDETKHFCERNDENLTEETDDDSR